MENNDLGIINAIDLEIKNPLISVVMGYYNRRELVINTLDCFERNYKKYSFEVIIVDDASDEIYQLYDIIKTYSFPIKYLVITKEEKGNRMNPCVSYNLGFKNVSGKYVIIQNPECMHVGDIFEKVINNLSDNKYLSFSCFNTYSKELSDKMINDLKTNNIKFNKKYIGYNNYDVNHFAWYNHPKKRCVDYHFCTAITKYNLDQLQGFDEKYKNGMSYDDDEFLYRIKYVLRLNIIRFNPDSVYVIHQYHGRFKMNNKISEKINVNASLFNKLKKGINRNFSYPRIIHFFWVGKMSFLNYLSVLSFRRFHPKWIINVYTTTLYDDTKKWTTKEQKLDIISEKDYFEKLKLREDVNVINVDNVMKELGIDKLNYIYQSDIFRNYILFKSGGLWSDFDIIYLKNIQKMFLDKSQIGKDIFFKIKNYYPIGLFLSKRSSKNFEFLYKKQLEIVNNKNMDYQKFGSEFLRSMILKNSFLKNSIFMGKQTYLYVEWNQLDLLFKKNIYFPKKTIGVHWFNGSFDARNYVNNFDRNNFKISCTMDRLVSSYLYEI